MLVVWGFFSLSALNISENLLLEFSLNSDCFSLATSSSYSPTHIVLESTETECCSYVFTWSRYNFLFRAPVSENITLQWFIGWLKLLVLPKDGTRNENSIKSDFPLQSKAFESECTSEPFVCQMGGGNSVEKMQSRCEKKVPGGMQGLFPMMHGC